MLELLLSTGGGDDYRYRSIKRRRLTAGASGDWRLKYIDRHKQITGHLNASKTLDVPANLCAGGSPDLARKLVIGDVGEIALDVHDREWLIVQAHQQQGVPLALIPIATVWGAWPDRSIKIDHPHRCWIVMLECGYREIAAGQFPGWISAHQSV